MKVFKIYKYLTGSALLICIVLAALILWSDKEISSSFVLPNTGQLSIHRVDTAVVLGIISTLYNGEENPFFRNRINAACELYKVDPRMHFIVSGNYNRRGYNEAKDIATELYKCGISRNAVSIDDSSYRTYDTMRRLRDIYKLDEAVFISQKFHLERACYLAAHFNIQAKTFVAEDPEKGLGIRVKLREYFARLKAIIDVNVVQPRVREVSPG